VDAVHCMSTLHVETPHVPHATSSRPATTTPTIEKSTTSTLPDAQTKRPPLGISLRTDTYNGAQWKGRVGGKIYEGE
jgi:hypothetical protein